MNAQPLFVLGVLATIGACGWLDPIDDVEPSTPSEARSFPIFSPTLAETTAGQGFDALAQDAWRREVRFMDAIAPGFAFRSVRPHHRELTDGTFESADWFSMGAQLFTMNFTEEQGFGGADLPAMSRFHRGERGGPDARRCAACHWRGGLAGAGDASDNAFFRGDGNTEASALARNPPSLVGAGWKELVAASMTADLHAQRDEAVVFARSHGTAFQLALSTHGVSFGAIEVAEDGTVDLTGLEGIDDDLVVKPFGWKGTFETSARTR